MNIQTYTDNEINKNLALLENHFKQAPFGDDIFCKDCINKHLILLEGLAEEGMTASGDSEKYQKIYDFATRTKGGDYKSRGIEFANDTRKLRKSLSTCSDCERTLGKKGTEVIKKLTKHLNNTETFNNNLNKMEYTELAYMNAGQFAAEGIRYFAETNATLMPYEKYVTIGGGIGLQVLGLFVKQLPAVVKTISLVAGSNLLANGVIKLVKGAVTPTASLRASVSSNNQGMGGYAGKTFSYAPSFGGPTFAGRVTAQNIPTRYARAGILSGAQAFESPEHADLIRVD